MVLEHHVVDIRNKTGPFLALYGARCNLSAGQATGAAAKIT
jgi:hypothetical protein